MAASSSSFSSSFSSSDLSVDRHVAATLYDQLYLSVRRSMSLLHFSGFESLHRNLRVVYSTAVDALDLNLDHLSNFFPHPPEKVRRNDWMQFDDWLSTSGKALQNLCFDWSFYRRFTIRTCETCRKMSTNLGWDDDPLPGAANQPAPVNEPKLINT